MKRGLKTCLVVTLIILSGTTIFAQVNFNAETLRKSRYTVQEFSNITNNTQSENIIERHNRLLKEICLFSDNNSKSADTLYVGDTPEDSLYITGFYTFNGTIAVVGDGKLVFENADAMINGNLVVFGNDAKVWITNSTIRFPQSFIYQRAMIAAGNAEINVTNSTLDYYGLSHDLVITDNAIINWNDVTKIGFTTCGLSLNATINIDGANQAGEFVMTNNATANFSNAATILIWHHVPAAAELDYVFPDGLNINTCDFDNSISGVTGIDYSYSISNCSDVMWGLMPEPSCNVTISDSKLRTIGVWFRNTPTYSVSGLVNNSHYNDFTAPLSEHNIHLVNTDVQTWNLYMFEGAEGNVSSCILGEIGTMGNSGCTIQNSFIDGSGGYLFATDQSMSSLGFSYLNANFQTSGEAIGIMAYSSQNMGRCIAFEKSILIIVQSNLTENPEYIDDAMVWYLKIDGSTNNYTNSYITINGSAWMEKASDFYPNDMAWYVAEYQVSGSGLWLPACDTVYSEVFNDELCVWNTEGLTPGSYNIRITMCDNTPEQNKVEAIKQFILSDNLTGTYDELKNNNFTIYPNPASMNSEINIKFENSEYSDIEFYDNKGTMIKSVKVMNNNNRIKVSDIFGSPGIYQVKAINYINGKTQNGRIVVL